MTLRSVVLAILSLLALIFLILNWQGITAPVPVNLIVEEIQAPLGLILLVILGGLWLFGIAWALMQQASTLVEIRKAYKEANANKSLADHAEQSRLEQTKESLRQEMIKSREELLAGIKAAVEAPTASAQDAQKRLRIEQIADKAQIGPAPELPASEPKKSGFFGFLGGSKSNKPHEPSKNVIVESPVVPTAPAAVPEPESVPVSDKTDAAKEESAQSVEPTAKPKDGFFKKIFH